MGSTLFSCATLHHQIWWVTQECTRPLSLPVLPQVSDPNQVGSSCDLYVAPISSSRLDRAIGAIKKACEENGYVLLITADHGNAEVMIDEEGNPVTKHTTCRGKELLVQQTRRLLCVVCTCSVVLCVYVCCVLCVCVVCVLCVYVFVCVCCVLFYALHLTRVTDLHNLNMYML